MARSDLELQAAAHHVAHEVRMLRRAWAQQSDPLAYTAWFVHCRNLIKFFDSKGQKDEIRVADFITGVENEWQAGMAGVARPLQHQTYWDAVDKLAAHLTWDRADPQWADLPPSAEITEYLLGLTGLLMRVLPVSRVGWFGGLAMP